MDNKIITDKFNLNAGIRVRLKANPGMIGVLTGRIRKSGDRELYQIQFPINSRFVSKDQFEIILDEDPFDLLKIGRLGRARDLRHTLAHVKLNGKLADLLYSMETTNTDFYPYQFKPVLKMLNSPSNGILIADEVGLGKTIEAGLIWTELKTRFDLRRLFVLCPAFLRVKWKRELKNRFGIDAEIKDATGALETLKHAAEEGPFASYAIICSMQGLRPQKEWNDIASPDKKPSSKLARFIQKHQHETNLIDMLIIDEAHYMRIADINRPEKKKTAILGRLLRDISEYVVLLSATPIHLRSDDLYQLTNLVDEATFNQPRYFDEILRANSPLIKLRDTVLTTNITKEKFIGMVKDAISHPLLTGNKQLSLLIEKPPENENLKDLEYRSRLAYRIENINLLGHIVNRTRKRDVTEWRVVRQAKPEKVEMTIEERNFYDKVTQIVRDFCHKYEKHEGFLLVTPQRQISSSMPAALQAWKKKGELYEELLYEDIGAEGSENSEEIGPVVKEIIRNVENFGDLDIIRKNDSKYIRLIEVLKKLFGENQNEKVIIFSYFIPTLEYLSERLDADGINNIVLRGGEEFDKDAIIDKFENPDGPSVLLSSEVGSEGIDLQFCRVVINYDLPWNPMRLEQRIGRIDRLGQKEKQILIWNLIYDDTIDSRIYDRLYYRLKIIENALGGFEQVLGDEIGKLTMDLILGRLTPEQENKRIEQTAQAIINIKQEEERLENEAANLVAFGDYILNQVKAMHDLHRWINGGDIKNYVIDYFTTQHPACIFKQSTKDDPLLLEVSLSNDAKYSLEQFIKNERIYTNTLLTRNNPSPVLCKFDNKIVFNKSPRIETINQIHPIVRYVNHQIINKEINYHPTHAIKINSATLNDKFKKGLYLYLVQWWSVSGLQEVEKLLYVVVPLDGQYEVLSDTDAEFLINTGAARGEDWLEYKAFINLDEAHSAATNLCLVKADQRYEQYIQEIKNQNEDRANLQLRTLDMHLKIQLEKLEEVKYKHIEQKREPLAKATEGKMNAIRNRVERKKLEIQEGRKIQYDKNEVCIGIINIY